MSAVSPQSVIRALCLDVDGVLTDGGVYWDSDGRDGRRFDVQDGFAIRWFQQLGGKVVLCSGKDSRAVAHRSTELKIDRVLQGSRDKVADVEPVLRTWGLRWDELAVVGDDLTELGLLRRCGYPIAVANAVEEVKAIARFVTRRPGGHGAVREAVEHLLRRSGQWARVLAHYEAQAGTADQWGPQ